MVLWRSEDLFKLDLKKGLSLSDGVDHEDVVAADPDSKKSNFVNGAVDIVSDLLLGKADILGLALNPNLSDEDRADGVIDEFVIFGRKNVKYFEVCFCSKMTRPTP